MSRYFNSDAASGGNIDTYGLWEDSNQTCFGRAPVCCQFTLDACTAPLVDRPAQHAACLLPPDPVCVADFVGLQVCIACTLLARCVCSTFCYMR